DAAAAKVWANYSPRVTNVNAAVSEFARYLTTGTSGGKTSMDAPFVPTMRLWINTSWQANDPLVHYTTEDLLDKKANTDEVKIFGNNRQDAPYTDPIPEIWARHVGAAYMPETLPTNDWRLADLITTALHPNATRGQLSVNQTNLAAWSAVLSGLGVTTLAYD